jgi:hypothetical protein
MNVKFLFSHTTKVGTQILFSINDIILWRKLNTTVLKKGLTNFNIKGFMVNSSQAYSNEVRIVYKSGDPIVKMIDKEQNCFFNST